MARSCRWCGGPLSGAQTHYDSATCKAKQNAFEHSLAKLAELPEAELREILRGVFVKRWGLYGKTRRFHLRFGEYQEGQPKPVNPLDLEVERAAAPGVERIGLHTPYHRWRPALAEWGSWSSYALRVVARMLERKQKEAKRGAA